MTLFEDYKRFALRPKSELLQSMINEGRWLLYYKSATLNFPIDFDSIQRLIDQYVAFYPVYENYVSLSSSHSVELPKQIDLLRAYLIKKEEFFYSDKLSEEGSNPKISTEQLLALANKKVKVMPAMRWQVFQRDDWRCVACGRNSEHGIVLHIDHIIPRSRGGTDHLDNYQTLCVTCNIGKSNCDQTNLRSRNGQD